LTSIWKPTTYGQLLYRKISQNNKSIKAYAHSMTRYNKPKGVQMTTTTKKKKKKKKRMFSNEKQNQKKKVWIKWKNLLGMGICK